MAGNVMSILSHNWATSHYEAMCVVIFLQLSDFPLIKKLKISASVGPNPAEWILFTFVISGSQWLRCSSCHVVYQPEPAFFFFSHQKLSLWTAAAKFMLCVEIYSCCVLNYEWISSRWQLILIFVVSINILSCVSCIHGNVFVFVTGLSCFKCINNSIIQAMYTQWPLLVTPPPVKSSLKSEP